eukprot:SAG31_NODE_485_length_15021_cov_9.439791_15_plen_69_part_00
MKSIAMALPAPLAAVPLASGTARSGMRDVSDAAAWAQYAGPFILGFGREDNGRSLSIPGHCTGADNER